MALEKLQELLACQAGLFHDAEERRAFQVLAMERDGDEPTLGVIGMAVELVRAGRVVQEKARALQNAHHVLGSTRGQA